MNVAFEQLKIELKLAHNTVNMESPLVEIAVNGRAGVYMVNIDILEAIEECHEIEYIIIGSRNLCDFVEEEIENLTSIDTLTSFLKLTQDEQDAVVAYCEGYHHSFSCAIEKVENNECYIYDGSPEDWAEDTCREVYHDVFDNMPAFIESSIDWSHILHQLRFDVTALCLEDGRTLVIRP